MESIIFSWLNSFWEVKLNWSVTRITPYPHTPNPENSIKKPTQKVITFYNLHKFNKTEIFLKYFSESTWIDWQKFICINFNFFSRDLFFFNKLTRKLFDLRLLSVSNCLARKLICCQYFEKWGILTRKWFLYSRSSFCVIFGFFGSRNYL